MTSKIKNTPRRLHPLVALFSSLKAIRDMLVLIIIILISTFIRGSDVESSYYQLVILGVLALLTLFWGILYWRTFTYVIEEGEFRVQKGVLIKEKKYIPLEKIHSIDFSENILHQLFDVVQVRIQTAGGMEPEVQLTAVTKEEAERLKKEILSWNKESAPQEEIDVMVDQERKITTRELVMTGLTSGKIGIIFSGVITLISFLSENFEEVDFTDFLPRFADWQGYMVLGAVVLLITWLISVIYTIILYGNFTIQRKEDKLFIRYGIIERKQFTISQFRIQSVKMVEGLLRQPFGYVTLHLVYAGGAFEQPRNVLLFPLIKKDKVHVFLETFLPEYAESVAFQGLPARAKRRYILWNTLPLLPVIGVLIYFFSGWGLLSLLLLTMGWIFGTLKFRDAGFALKGNKMVLRRRSFARITGIIPLQRVQSHTLEQSYFQERKDLVTFRVLVASSFAGEEFFVKDLDEKDGNLLFERLSKNKKVEGS